MKIVELRAENFKRLKAVDITPDENIVVLAGRNAQGKSSVLDAIWAALAGAAGSVDRAIRDGERKAAVQVTLDDLVVTRKWSGSRSTLEVAARNGSAKHTSPQKVLDELVGKLSFDPLAFAEADDKSQAKALRDVIGIDFTDIEAQRKEAYDSRTDYNRDVKRLTAQLEGIDGFDATTPDEPIDIADLAKRASEASHARRDVDSLREEWQRNVEHIERIRDRQTEIVNEAARLATLAESAAELEAQVAGAYAVNQAVQAKDLSKSIQASLDAAGDESSRLSERIDELDAAKTAMLAKAKMPIAGLSFDEDGVLYQGIPFSQASAAERLRVSVAMAMALNPEARIVLIRDGSLLDSENMALIESMAVEKDFQVWIERVDESGQVGIVIEDGMVS